MRLRRALPALVAAALMTASNLAAAQPAIAAVSCTVDYSVTNEWDVGFGANVTIRNVGTDSIDGWNLTWTFPDGQRVTQLWNGTFTQTNAAVSVRNLDYNRLIPAAGNVQFGFNGSKGATNRPPTDFAVNGVACVGPNKAPTVQLTSPADNSSYTVPATIPLAATASDTDGTIAKVEFYADTTLLGTDTTAPYQFSWTGAAAGQYSVTAKAYDDKGASTVSTPIAVRVLSSPTVLATPSTVNIRQGTSTTVDVSLATQPSSSVAVTVARTSGSTDLTATPAQLTFTTANWNTAQKVTIASAANGGALASATFSATATGYTAATVTATELDPSTPEFKTAFLAQYNKIKDPNSGYFRNFGGLLVPYHSVETLMVEAPDQGHETTSEAFSYYLWLEAAFGELQGDWAPFNAAWASLEKYMIPAHADQPTNDKYNASKPATYAPENPRMDQYPAQLDGGIPVGSDPIAAELKAAYGTDDIYGMHWLLDVDNTYKFGHCGDGTTAPAFINTYQRGSSESVWETIPQPSCDQFKFGGPNGYLDLFTKDSSYAKQWKYTDAPDADARAVQVAYLAQQWATAQGKAADVSAVVKKASKMGDYLRYAMFDKYFKKIGGCTSPSCPAGTGKDSDHYLMSWYYAWGGATDTSAGWAWRIGDGASHQGYQNPLAAYALSNDPTLKPLSATGAADWSKSLDRQLEFLQFLQSNEGGIAGGATNSWEGHYGPPPAGTPTFYGMAYDPNPVWHDPPSNRWFGFQVWDLERVASFYQFTGDARAKKILDKWVPWAIANTTTTATGFQIPADLEWTGAPVTWNPTSPAANTGLHVRVLNQSQDVGVAASYAKTLLNYAAKSGNAAAKTTGEALLNALLAHTDTLGIAIPETRTDYNRFDDTYNSTSGEGTYVPPGWTGKMPNGDPINQTSTFLSIRSFYKNDPQWSKVQSYLDGGAAPTFTYHRFWAQAEIATAFSLHVQLFGS
jgi:hypothetical protein